MEKMKEAFLAWAGSNFSSETVEQDIRVFLKECKSGKNFHDSALPEELILKENAENFSEKEIMELVEVLTKK